uniref:Uncharacterized protein n=1 Tax=Heterorhabditis bacteriophora TaxID=37862 RepID=A0A1I7WSP9_HETBA
MEISRNTQKLLMIISRGGRTRNSAPSGIRVKNRAEMNRQIAPIWRNAHNCMAARVSEAIIHSKPEAGFIRLLL